MSDVTKMIIIELIAAGTVSLLLFAILRRGLGLKLILIQMAAYLLIVFAAFWVGNKGFGASDLGFALALGSVAAVFGIVTVHRLVFRRVTTAVQTLISSTTQLSSAASQAAASSSELAASVSQVTATAEELNQTTQVANEAAQSVVKVATEAVERGTAGQEAAGEGMKIMDLIADTVEVIDTINELAEQSNLLAVNASIEAAKAGDYGKGFAVVAAEVRSLAEQSKEATSQVREAIRRTERGREIMSSINVVLKQLGGVLDTAADRSRQIAGSAVQQAAGVQQIVAGMQNIQQAGSDNASVVKQLEQSILLLRDTGESLHKFIRG